MLKDSKSLSFTDQHREPLPFLERKKLAAESYVSERVSRIRKQKQKAKQWKDKTIEQQSMGKWKEVDQIKELKKNFLVSSNKVVSSDQILSSFQPFKKELQILKKKPSATINYEELISNLHPFSNAIRQLEQKSKQKKKFIRSIQDSPASVKLYRSIPKRKMANRAEKPVSESRIKYQEVYFLNVGKISLLDSEDRKNKKNGEVYHSAFADKRTSSYSLQEIDENYVNQEINNSFRGNFSKIKMKLEEIVSENTETKLPKISNNDQSQQFEDQIKQEQPAMKQQNSRKESPFKIPKKRKKITNAPFETYFYRSMIWKVNYSNLMNVEVPQEYEHRLRVYVGKGNNSGLVRGLIKRRIWFAVTDKIEEANFVWTQLKSLPYFKLQEPSSNERGKIETNQPGQHYIPTFITKIDQKQFTKYIENYYQSEQRADERLLFRSKFFIPKYTKSIKIGQIKCTRMQNHLINNYVIGNKKALFNTMSAYYAERGEEVFDYLPLTFHIKQGLEDQSYFKFLKYYYNRAKQIKASNSKCRNIWIVKPGQNSNRGNGISVCLNLEQIKTILKRKEMYPDGTYRTYIVQSYIEKPLLYNKRKFDLRHYMMISCINGIVKGYWYRQGYVRTTSTEYSLGTNCSKIHLTNDAVQKNLPDYGKFQKGNKLSYDELQAYIAKVSGKKKETVSFRQHILPKMKKIATDAIRACSGGIDPDRKESNFQIFGLDFMIDADFKLYLIQINTNPCLELSCPLLGAIIPKMVENTLEMTLDAQFPPPVRYYPKGMHYFKNLEEENRYELVYDSRYEKLYDCSMAVLDQKLLQQEDDTFEDDGEEFDPDD